MKYLTNFNTLQEYEDALILDVPNVSYIVEDKIVKYHEYPKYGSPPNNQIWYTSTDEEIVEPRWLHKDIRLSEPLNIVKNEYYPGLGGVIETDGDIIAAVEGCFLNKDNLKHIILPDSIVILGSDPFLNCGNLTSIKIGKNFNGNDGWFTSAIAQGSLNLENIIIDSKNPYCYDNNQTSIIRKKDNCLIQGTKNTVIPNTVKKIGRGAFYGIGLTDIIIPNTVEYLEGVTFAGNNNLTRVILPNTINLIDEGDFWDCINLNTINIPTSGRFPGYSLMNTAIWNNEENWYNDGLYWDNALLYIRDVDSYNIYIVKSGTKTICSQLLGPTWDWNYPIKLPNSIQNILDYAFVFIGTTELYYDGTVDTWNSINKSDLWNANSAITVIHCIDEDIQI